MNESLKTLSEMLSYARPYDSHMDREFINRFIKPLGVKCDDFGNYYKVVGDEPPTILWSCHTDSVHAKPQRVAVTVKKGIARLAENSKANCLGADDAAGVWLCREMILAGVPGLYIFHRGEECGGLGSAWIAKHTPELLDGIQAAIALDRKGYNSVITHQGWERCCSQEFAESLADMIGLGYKLDDTGVFTDTANYTDLIGECTNLSVGYMWEHTKSEQLDTLFLLDLRDRLIKFDQSGLVFKRAPGEVDPADLWEPDPTDRGYRLYDYTEVVFDADDDLEHLVEEFPGVAADLIEGMGYTAKEFRNIIRQYGFDKLKGDY